MCTSLCGQMANREEGQNRSLQEISLDFRVDIITAPIKQRRTIQKPGTVF